MRSDEFTYSYLIEVLEQAKQSYRFAGFSEINMPGPFIILRHDIDFSVARAVRFAQIEYGLGIKATYFLMLQSPHYNLLRPDNLEMARRLLELGHAIGYHYYLPAYDALNLDRDLGISGDVHYLESLLKTKVESVGQHNPGITDPDFFAKKFLDAGAEGYRKDVKYISDSSGHWRWGHIGDALGMHEKLHVALHPIWWNDEALDAATTARVVLESEVQRDLEKVLENIRVSAKSSSLP